MEWETVSGGSGSIYEINNIKDGDGKRIAHRFLNNVSNRFAKECKLFYNEVGDLPYIYSERQVHSALFPAIQKVSDVTFLEQPIDRKRMIGKKKDGHGWVDYWVKYGQNVFLIELKHSWLSYKNVKLNAYDNKATWKELLMQLKSIKNSDARFLADKSCNVIKMGLMVMPLYSNSKKEESGHLNKRDALEMLNSVQHELDADWSCFWHAPKTILTESFPYYEDGKKAYSKYPGIILASCINSIGKGTYEI